MHLRRFWTWINRNHNRYFLAVPLPMATPAVKVHALNNPLLRSRQISSNQSALGRKDYARTVLQSHFLTGVHILHRYLISWLTRGKAVERIVPHDFALLVARDDSVVAV